ncbi:MAG: aminoacyl-tRNA hydrolase [Clostridia bacterium]|nr:aminoacyl-tRNA hydrolase [Clostridia bacterium]
MIIIIGLGNPGLEYRKTYHNIGFRCVDKLAESLGVTFKHKYCNAKAAEYYLNGEKIVIAKPQTYMNLSGDSVKQLAAKFKAQNSEILIVYDDIDLPFGSIRIRSEGSAGTHNGMKSIVANMGKNIPRLRAGIGRGPEDVPLFSYVLSRVSKDKALQEDKLTDTVCAAINYYIETKCDIEKVGQRFNEKGE